MERQAARGLARAVVATHMARRVVVGSLAVVGSRARAEVGRVKADRRQCVAVVGRAGLGLLNRRRRSSQVRRAGPGFDCAELC